MESKIPSVVDTEEKVLIESLILRVQNLEAKSALVEDLKKENTRLKERADLADQAKDALMRLCWQHLETNDRI